MAATEVITVASYTSRHQWIDQGGTQWAVGLALNTISDFSSPGPRRDGVRKPDVTAPGAMIVSCLSSSSQVSASNIVTTGYRVNAGTSMACPFVTGVIALLLERNAALTPAEAKQFLKQRSAVPNMAAGAFDAKWGFGPLISVQMGDRSRKFIGIWRKDLLSNNPKDLLSNSPDDAIIENHSVHLNTKVYWNHLTANGQSPGTRHQAPGTRHQAPGTKHQPPITLIFRGRKILKAEHTSSPTSIYYEL
ncbi:MAG: S8 family serine peptidase [Verrucomicrobiales bacterium]